MRGQAPLVRLDLASEHLDRLGDRDQLALEDLDSGAPVQGIDLRLDLVEPVGERDQLIVAVLVEGVQPVLDAGPAVFHAAHAVFASEAFEH